MRNKVKTKNITSVCVSNTTDQSNEVSMTFYWIPITLIVFDVMIMMVIGAPFGDAINDAKTRAREKNVHDL